MQHERIQDIARGKWKNILPSLGVPIAFLNGKHQACPICGGNDRARFDDKRGEGLWYCNQCGAGDGVQLVMAVNGIDFAEAKTRIEALAGNARISPVVHTRDEADTRASLNRLWRAARCPKTDGAVCRWLKKRIGLGEAPDAIREGNLKYSDGSYHPGMLAMVTSSLGAPKTIHRTYLTNAGEKADVAEPRKLFSEAGQGSAIRLATHDDKLAVAEGIETALSVTRLFSVPCWATINAVLMAGWEPPSQIKHIEIYGDNDENMVGQKAAYDLASKLYKRGLAVTVHIPPVAGEDWNDVLMKDGI